MTLLPSLERVDGWAMVQRSMGYVARPSTLEGVRDVLQMARDTDSSVGLRGSGYSYGDLSLNSERLLLDLSRMNRILAWDPAAGIISVEPGVTVQDLWRYSLEDGWWPHVVPGTMHPTLAGLAAVNAHGKNNWHAGTIEDTIVSLDLLRADGRPVTLAPGSELYHALVGSLGLLGVITSITLQLARVPSGDLEVREVALPSLGQMFDVFEGNLDSDYLVGWIDAFARGPRLGRGLIQMARYAPGPACTLRVDHQVLPDTVAGLFPRSRLWLPMKATVNDAGMRALNAARYRAGALQSGRSRRVPLAQFHFFHDFVPDWKRSFWPAGIVQYQVFVPAETARGVFERLLCDSQSAHLYPYLAVMKRHRRDAALLSYGLDGYSLSLDYHLTRENRERLRDLLRGFTWNVVLPAGGRFYPAKDDTLDAPAARASLGAEAVERFLTVKRELDPEEMFENNLYRRLLAPKD